MAYPTQDRLIRKEVALGTIRELPPPSGHIGLQYAPMLSVATDDVIFDYAVGLNESLAPARAEDAESELAQKDTFFGGTARASVIDWAQKDHYTASDVTRYRENALLAGISGTDAALAQATANVNTLAEDFRAKVARDDARRRRALDNRIEWLIMQAFSTGGIAYNDGKIKFAVDYGRPANQHNEAPPGGLWTLTTSDPIGDILAMQEFMYDTYSVRMTRAIASRKALAAMMNSDRFVARSGLALAGFSTPSGGTVTTPSTPLDLNYLLAGWGPAAAQAVVQAATGVTFREYDSVYRTRPVGSTTITNNRFLPENTIIFLPDLNDVADLGPDQVGFAKTLTSPHPEGNWQSGFYEWERDTVDPWGVDRGTGIKAFPVFPHMELTYTMTVLA